MDQNLEYLVLLVQSADTYLFFVFIANTILLLKKYKCQQECKTWVQVNSMLCKQNSHFYSFGIEND